MATVRACDRCMGVISPGTPAAVVRFSMRTETLGPREVEEGASPGPGLDGDDPLAYSFEELELCQHCAGVVLKLAKKMQLGPDAKEGGVRIVKNRGKSRGAGGGKGKGAGEE